MAQGINNVVLIGRLTKDPDVRYTESQMAIARFSLAIDRGKDKDGKDKGADFPNIVCFGKTAETVEKYLGKGRQIGIVGRLQTGSYEKNGQKIYTTEVVVDHFMFLDSINGASNTNGASANTSSSGGSKALTDAADDIPGFEQLTGDDIPF